MQPLVYGSARRTQYFNYLTNWGSVRSAKLPTRPGTIPNPESESKDESGFDSGFGIIYVVESDLESESCRFESDSDS